MGSGTSRSKVTTPVTPWSYSPEPGTPEHHHYSQQRLTSAQRLDAIARIVAQQEPFHEHPNSAQRLEAIARLVAQEEPYLQHPNSAQRLDAIARLVAQQESLRQNPNSAERLDAIARLIAQQESYHQAQRFITSNGHGESDRFQVPLYIQPSTPLKQELSDLQEIQDLQKTFDSLGIPETRIDDREERWVGGESMRRMDVGRVFGPRPDSADDEERLSTTSSVSSEPKSKSRAYQMMSQNKSVSAPTSIHKRDPSSEGSTEEWTYSKKEIDGFDPDKFRRVNNRAKNVSTFMAYHSNGGTPLLDAAHPHSVPNYDESEERIVGSIEREYSY